MDRILPVDALMSEVWSMYTGRDLKEFIEGKDYNSKTLNFVKSKLHDLKIEKKEKAIKWLSVGVGEGRDLQVLYAKGLRPINIDFYGIDISDNLFEMVEKSASALGIKQVHLEVVSAEDMDFNSKFDLISAILVLHEVDPTKLPLILRNMLRSLKKGGTLVISDFQKPYELEKNVVVWDDDDIKDLLEQISPKTGVSFEIMDSSEFPDEFGFYSCIIKKSGGISSRFFDRYKENITHFISTKIDKTRKEKEELADQVKNRIEEIVCGEEIDIDTVSKYETQIKEKLAEEEYNVKLFKVMLLRNQLEYLNKIHKKLVEVGVAPPTPPKDPIQVYVESIKNNDFFRYIPNPMVSRSIPLESLYVKLAISGIIHDPEHRFAMPDWAAGEEYQLFTERRYLEKVKEEIDPEKAVENWQRIVVLGDPGSGKTTLLKYLTLEAANGHLECELVPFFISLGEYADPRNKATSLIEFACEQYRKRSSLDQEEFGDFVLMVKDLNEKRKALFLLDGFDEIAHDLKHGVSGDIERELNRYLLSSRQVGYTGGVLNDKTLEVVELSDSSIQEFIRNWMRSQDVPDHEKSAGSMIGHIKRIPRLKMLARNPLLLSIQCFVYQSIVKSRTEKEMPIRMVDLYKEAINGLLKTLEPKGITSHDVDRLDRRINVDSVFGDIAFRYFEDVGNAPRHIIGREELHEDLRRISVNLKDEYAGMLSDVVFRSEILHPLTKYEYHFLHLTFQEYYVAYHLATQVDGIQTIVKKKRDPQWQEIIPLYAGMKSEQFQELIDLIWYNGRDEDLFYNDLFLVGRCLAEVDLKRAEIKSQDIENIKNHILELSLRGEFDIWKEGAVEVIFHMSYQFEDIEDKLIESLKDENHNVGSAAAEVLVEIGGERVVELVIPLLKDDDSSIRKRAAEALGMIGDERAGEHLIPLLKDDGPDEVSSAAAEALGNIRGERVMEHLIPLLKDEDSFVRWTAAEALGMIGDERAGEHLITLLKCEDYHVRWTAAVALGMIGDERAVEHLIPLLKDDGPDEVSSAAAEALGNIGGERVMEHLIPLLKDEDSFVRWTAAEALGMIGDEGAVEHLITLLKDEDSFVRWTAAEALGEIGDERAVKHLIPLLKDKDFYSREAAAEALGNIRDGRAVEYLIPLLKDEDCYTGWAAEKALGEIGDERAVKHLIPLLKDVEYHVRSTAAEALGEIGDERAVKHLIPLLKDLEYQVRWTTEKALVEIGGERTVEHLIPLLKDEESFVGEAAARALGGIGAERTVKHLILLLKYRGSDVRRVAARALGEIGDERAVEPLIPLLKDEESFVGEAAAEALRKISEKNDLYIPLSRYKNL